MNQDEARQKLLNIPHVVERLIRWLDPGSLLNLVHSKILTREVLRKSLTLRAWKDFIEYLELGWDEMDWDDFEEVQSTTCNSPVTVQVKPEKLDLNGLIEVQFLNSGCRSRSFFRFF